MLKFRFTNLIIWLIVLTALASSLFLYSKLPEKIVTHWNFAWEPDGYSPKLIGSLLIPGMMLLFAILYHAIPIMDPLRANINRFKKSYDGFFIVLSLFLLLIHLQVLLLNIGLKFNPALPFTLGISAIFFYSGKVMQEAEPNWFIGVRTPWTLSDPLIWKKTNQLSGTLFQINSALALIGLFLPRYAVWFILVPALVNGLFAIGYSYYLYRKQPPNQ